MTRMVDQAMRRAAASNVAARKGAATMPLRDLASPSQVAVPSGAILVPEYPPVPELERGLKITVLSGGASAEREVSLKSGRAVAASLTSLGHEVRLADITPGDLRALDQPMDMVFIALHGSFGEDGRLQRILEERGIRYCGSGPEASAVAMDKVAAKRRFDAEGIPTPRFEVVTRTNAVDTLHRWVGPAVIKPVAEGSSVDCELADDRYTLIRRVGELTERYGRCLIEEYIRGPELTVGILGEQALPPIDIRTKRRFYDYQAKYVDDDTQYLFDIDLPPDVLAEVMTLSERASGALGCRDFCRVDWMIDAASCRPYVLEINTIPGFTDHSLLPKAALRAGLSFPALCQRIIELSLQRDS